MYTVYNQYSRVNFLSLSTQLGPNISIGYPIYQRKILMAHSAIII